MSKIQLLALGLILIGLAIMLPRGIGMYQSYQEIEFAHKHQFQAGDVSPDLLRPWMTIRYIAVSYAVPQEYLFNAVRIPPRRENSILYPLAHHGAGIPGDLDCRQQPIFLS